MANFQEPPVYRATYELVLALTKFVRDCNKDYQPTLGILTQKEALELSLSVYRINERAGLEKAATIQIALDHCYAIRMLIRLMADIGIMKLDTNIFLNLKIEETSKQLSGWKKSCQGSIMKPSASGGQP